MTTYGKNAGGPPLTYTKELGDEICLKVATSNYGLSRLCKENIHWPHRQCIFEWRIKIKEFGDNYTKAKQEQIETLIDDCLDIADNTDNDTIIRQDKDGNDYEVCNSEYINRSRVRIDTRKWLASKLAPKIYGDKQEDKDNNKDEFKTSLREIKEELECLRRK